MSRALTQHGLKAAVKTDACSTLVSLNIFAGTEHDSASYGKVQESFRKHTAETANKGRAPPKSGVKFSKEASGSIKEQLRRAESMLNGENLVATVNAPDFNKMNIKQQRQWAESFLKNTGYAVDRKGFGRIEFTPKHINEGLNYLNSPAEIAAFAALPRVLKRGVEIDAHNNHKGRQRGSVTIAAPVKINGVRGNMAVAVTITTKNHYHAHRVLLPDGSEFTFEVKKVDPTPAEAAPNAESSPIKSTADSIRNSSENVKKYSLEPVEAIQPTSGEWKRGSTTEEVREVHPQLWAVDAESSETRNPTQISGTVKSYRKIYDALDAEGFNGTILDASSGLGYGTRAGREEYGFNVDDIEPFPDSSYKPKYTDYSKLHKKYDVIISNAVLNVLPQDQRDALVVKMGQMLNDGGRMFINVRGTDVRNASSKVPIDEANMEYYISNTGSYQKGFTKKELVAYLSDALGKDYTIVGTNKFGAVSAVVTKQAEVSKKFSREVKNAEEYFGTTYKVKEAGYICTDGKMLDFSGRHEGAPGGYRTVDHRDITDALGEDYGGEDYSGGMIKFMSEGNIRVSPESGGINLSVAPNKAQRSTLDRYISSFRGEVILDIDRTNGDTIASVEYPKYTHSSVVFKDIDDYFDKGKIPEKFSREPESITELRRQNETMLAQATNEDAANDNERCLIKDYKRQYDKVSGIAEKLNTARQELTAAENGGGNTTAKKKIKKHRTHCPVFGRGRRLRTLGLRFWRPPLYQLSYSPIKLVGLQGLEPQTDRL